MACIAIVGAGPSGAAAGRHLALQGHAVTLFDKSDFPRDKTCGDWLTPIALRELGALGLDLHALDALVPGHAQVRRSTLVSPDGRRSEHPSAPQGPQSAQDRGKRERHIGARIPIGHREYVDAVEFVAILDHALATRHQRPSQAGAADPHACVQSASWVHRY